jgi:hypothetical protein
MIYGGANASYILSLILGHEKPFRQTCQTWEAEACTVTVQNMDFSIPCWGDAPGAADQIDLIVSWTSGHQHPCYHVSQWSCVRASQGINLSEKWTIIGAESRKYPKRRSTMLNGC